MLEEGEKVSEAGGGYERVRGGGGGRVGEGAKLCGDETHSDAPSRLQSPRFISGMGCTVMSGTGCVAPRAINPASSARREGLAAVCFRQMETCWSALSSWQQMKKALRAEAREGERGATRVLT